MIRFRGQRDKLDVQFHVFAFPQWLLTCKHMSLLPTYYRNLPQIASSDSRNPLHQPSADAERQNGPRTTGRQSTVHVHGQKTQGSKQALVGVGIFLADTGGPSQLQPYRLRPPQHLATQARDRPGTGQARANCNCAAQRLGDPPRRQSQDVTLGARFQTLHLDSGGRSAPTLPRVATHRRNTSADILLRTCLAAWPHDVGSKLEPLCSRPRYEEPYG
jgi:hypothetical protein